MNPSPQQSSKIRQFAVDLRADLGLLGLIIRKNRKKIINIFMLMIVVGTQFMIPEAASAGSRFFCRRARCYYSTRCRCCYSSYYSGNYCDNGSFYRDDFFVRVGNELRYDAQVALSTQLAANQIAQLAILRGQVPYAQPQAYPTVQAGPAPVGLPQYQQPYPAPQQYPPAVTPQPLPQQYAQQQQPYQQPLQGSFLQPQQPMNNVPQVGVPQQPYQQQQPQYINPQQPPQLAQQGQVPQQPQQGQQGMGDPFPSQPPPLSGDQQQQPGQQPAADQGYQQPIDTATYLAGLKAAHKNILQTNFCFDCHSNATAEGQGANINLEDHEAMTSALAEKVFFQCYTGNMPKGHEPIRDKVKIDILSDYAFLLKQQGK